MIQIIFAEKALKQLKKLPRPVSKRIVEKISMLGGRDFSTLDVKKLAGHPFYRLRVGSYRVIFEKEASALQTHAEDATNPPEPELAIIILHVDHRKRIYKGI